MILAKIPPDRSDQMICFEREYFYEELVAVYTDKKTGRIVPPN